MALTNAELRAMTLLALTEPPQRCKPGEAPEPEPPVANPYLTFYSPDGEFWLNAPYRQRYTDRWNGEMQYSTDTENWLGWYGSESIQSSGGYLYLRGLGNTRVTTNGYPWTFSGSSPLRVSCFGNIENLLDYRTVENGEHPPMAEDCFIGMFVRNANLITAPELPATTLSSGCYAQMFRECTALIAPPSLPATRLSFNCYSNMFYGCTGLTRAPELPATMLASRCYNEMFQECTSLITIPKLPATILEEDCYYHMFLRCSSVKLSNTQSDTYSYPYRIPTTGTGTTASYALRDMFTGTGGPWTGTPTINTTYYTDHEPV